MTISIIAAAVSATSGLVTLALFFIKPFREKVLGTKSIREGQRCLLRSDMLAAYYSHKDEAKLRQYQRQNLDLEYAAYKALGGNSFIDDVYAEARRWEVDT